MIKNPKHLHHPEEYVDATSIGGLINRVVRANDIVKSTPSDVTLINVCLNGVQVITKEQCIECRPNPVSVLQTLGEVHIRGKHACQSWVKTCNLD